MLSMLARLRRSKHAANAAALRITVYSRKQCCCCQKAMDLLEKYRRRHRFTVDVVDIDTDPALVQLYDTSVPVVVVNGKVRFKGVVNPALFERLLLAEGRG